MKINNFEFGKQGMKYEVVKVILICKLLEKYKKKRYWVQIFPEMEYEEGMISSVYVIDEKSNEVIYHISKQDSTDKKYENFKKNGGRVVSINIKKLSDNINQIEKALGGII